MNRPAPQGAATSDLLADAPAAGDPSAGTLTAARRLIWLLVVPVLLLLAVLTLLQYRQRIEDAERALLREADERAQELEAIARPAMAHVHDLRLLLEQRWHDPPDGGPAMRDALSPRRRADGRHDGWSLDAAPDAVRERFGQFWWAPADGRAPEAAWLRRAELFVEHARIVQRRAPGFEAAWFAAAEVNASFGYPWVDTATMLRAMGAADLQAVDVPRQAGVQRAERSLAIDPNEQTFWGTPYVSQLDGAWSCRTARCWSSTAATAARSAWTSAWPTCRPACSAGWRSRARPG